MEIDDCLPEEGGGVYREEGGVFEGGRRVWQGGRRGGVEWK
jgi:hypothetical protein